jgi:hypothetical protein
MIKKYLDFINESLDSSEIMEEIINALAAKGNKLASILKNGSMNYEDDNDINFLDIGSTPQMITYLPLKKRPESKSFRYGDPSEYEAKGRVEVKVGRAIRKIISDLMQDVKTPSTKLVKEYSGPIKFNKTSIFIPKDKLKFNKLTTDEDDDDTEILIIESNPLVKLTYEISTEVGKKKVKYSNIINNGIMIYNPDDYGHSDIKGTNTMLELTFKSEDTIIESESDDEVGSDRVTYIFSDGTRLNRKEETPVNAWISIKIECDTAIPDAEIEKFVNEYVGMLKTISGSGGKIVEVKGNDIRDIYSGKGHAIASIGQLGNSCMVGKDAGVFDLYVKNPNVCSLLVLKNEDKTLGRALLWKLSDGNKFMDRVYTLSDADVNIFENYAIKNKYYYRSSGNNDKIKIYYNGKKVDKKLIVDLDVTKFKQYPYMDTLCYFSESTGILTNRDKKSNGKYTYEKELRDTAGGFSLPFNREHTYTPPDPEIGEHW